MVTFLSIGTNEQLVLVNNVMKPDYITRVVSD